MTTPTMELAKKILEAVTDYRIQHEDNPPGDIRVSCQDIQQMFDEQWNNWDPSWRGEHKVFKPGDTGQLWGRPIVVDAALEPGHAWVAGREVVA